MLHSLTQSFNKHPQYQSSEGLAMNKDKLCPPGAYIMVGGYHKKYQNNKIDSDNDKFHEERKAGREG